MKFEFKEVRKWGTMSDDDFYAALNDAGSEGWDVVNFTLSDDGSCTAFMRRVLE